VLAALLLPPLTWGRFNETVSAAVYKYKLKWSKNKFPRPVCALKPKNFVPNPQICQLMWDENLSKLKSKILSENFSAETKFHRIGPR
jgi:hypothetical protein